MQPYKSLKASRPPGEGAGSRHIAGDGWETERRQRRQRKNKGWVPLFVLHFSSFSPVPLASFCTLAADSYVTMVGLKTVLIRVAPTALVLRRTTATGPQDSLQLIRHS